MVHDESIDLAEEVLTPSPEAWKFEVHLIPSLW